MLHTSPNVNTSKNVVKSGSCVKTTAWSIVVKEGTNTLIFYIFEYDAESGAECSAEYGAK